MWRSPAWDDKAISVNGEPVARFSVPGSCHCHAIDNTCVHEDGASGWARFAAASLARRVRAHESQVTSGD